MGSGLWRELMEGEMEKDQGCNLREEELSLTEGEGGKEAERNRWREELQSSGS